MKKEGEAFISVDVESDGSFPGRHSLLSIGACVVDDPEKNFYCELRPISEFLEPAAMRVNGLDRERLKREGLAPEEAMRRFGEWVREVSGETKPVFIGLNAAFDWLFCHWYFVNFLGEDPFGYSALDIEAYYMGMAGEESWKSIGKSTMPKEFVPERVFTHNALEDALYQAEMFRRMRAHNKKGGLR